MSVCWHLQAVLGSLTKKSLIVSIRGTHHLRGRALSIYACIDKAAATWLFQLTRWPPLHSQSRADSSVQNEPGLAQASTLVASAAMLTKRESFMMLDVVKDLDASDCVMGSCGFV